MELLYLWIEDYKNIHHQGFNFSNEYRFTFKPDFRKEADGKLPTDKDGKDIFEVIGGTLDDEDLYLNIKEEKDKPFYNFFEPSEKVKDAWKDRKDDSGNPLGLGKITNITAIVGENGAGKSNLLEFIRYEMRQVIDEGKWKDKQKSFFVFKESENKDPTIKFCYWSYYDSIKLSAPYLFMRLINPKDIRAPNYIYYSNYVNLQKKDKSFRNFKKIKIKGTHKL